MDPTFYSHVGKREVRLISGFIVVSLAVGFGLGLTFALLMS